MCPVCMATALASFAVLMSISVFATVGTDKWCLLLISILGFAIALHLIGVAFVAWWGFGAQVLALVIRGLWVRVNCPTEAFAVVLWKRSVRLAKGYCLRKNSQEC